MDKPDPDLQRPVTGPAAGDSPPPATRSQAAVLALLIALASLGLLLPAATEVGPSWDEAYYIDFADHIEAWGAAGCPMDPAALATHWLHAPQHNPHPPGIKVVSAAVRLAGARYLPFPLSYRLGPILANVLCLALLAFLLGRTLGRATALGVWAFVLLQPRCFAHAGFVATDMPLSLAAWLVVPVLVWYVSEHGGPASGRWAWALVAGCLWGGALATKFPACLVVVPVGGWVIAGRRWRLLPWLGVIGATAAAVFFLVSPVHVVNPVRSAVDYLAYPFRGVQVAFWTYYLGVARQAPDLPWHYTAVMLVATLVPFALPLALAAPVALRRSPGGGRALGALLAWLAGTWLVLALLPSTPKHDVERQLLPLVVLLSAAAGVGAAWAARVLAVRFRVAHGEMLGVLLCALLLLAVLWPYRTSGLSYFSPWVGGVAGVDRSGLLPVSYWLEQVDRRFLADLNRVLPPGAAVTMEPNPQHLAFLQRQGWVRPDVRVVESREQAAFVLLVRNDGLLDLAVFRAVRYPILERTVGGVPVARLFRIR